MKYRKLELTWFNKDKVYVWDGEKKGYMWVEPRDLRVAEPRILIEKKVLGSPNSSYNPDFRKWLPDEKISRNEQNLFIKGDNLLALKALEQDFAGKIKLIYIDPPFNTGVAYEQYDDGLEHSLWLTMMKSRLEILRNLLSSDGAILVHIDYREAARLKLLMDEVFWGNFRNEIIVKRGTKNVQNQFDTIDSLASGHDSILVYTKSSDTRFKHCKSTLDEVQPGSWNNHWRGTDRPTMRYEIFGIKPESGQWRWSEERTKKAIKSYQEYIKNYSKDMTIDEYYVMKLTDKGKKIDFVRLSSTGKPEHYIPPRTYRITSDVWMDVMTSGKITSMIHEKHEELLFRIISWLTEPNDWVLDSFAGSATTAAVAHKLGRRWIAIELHEEQAEKDALPRLTRTIKGENKEGISKEVKWKGSGGFRYCVLGESLFRKDDMGIVEVTYDNGPLIEAVCKIEGFKFVGREFIDKTNLHGVVNDKRFCHVTEEFVTQDYVENLMAEIKKDESIVIYCMKKTSRLSLPDNVQAKKIPRDIVKKFKLES